jgi:hypothetical protein
VVVVCGLDGGVAVMLTAVSWQREEHGDVRRWVKVMGMDLGIFVIVN